MTSDRGPARYPDGDAGEILEIFDAAVQPILGDRAVWDEERRRTGAAPLPWPLKASGTGYEMLMRYLVELTVGSVLDAMRRDTVVVVVGGTRVTMPNLSASGFVAVPAPDPAVPEFQIVLRVVKRACDAAEAALVARFGGGGRMSVRRDLVNFAKRLRAEQAVRSGLPRAEAFRQAGLARSTGYRVLGGKRPKGD